MKIGSLNGLGVLVRGDRALPIGRASAGRHHLRLPVPRPRQVVAIGVNYLDRAAEAEPGPGERLAQVVGQH